MLLSLDCGYCGGPASHFCGDCAQINYCSEECQEAHWQEEHQFHHKIGFDIKEIEKSYDLEEIEADGTYLWAPKPELIGRRRRKKWMQGAVKHPGSFKRAAKKRHMSTAKFASHVLADKKHKHYTVHRFRQAMLYRRFKQSHHRKGKRGKRK